MKAEPTDIDREAAQIFTPALGMRWLERERGTWWTVTPRDFFGDGFKYRLVALDTDDPATVGVMLAQVEKAANGRAELLWEWGSDRIDFVTRWQYIGGTTFERRGPTRGAALVAAMRAIKGDPTR